MPRGSLKSRLGCHLEAVAQEVAQSGVARARAELHREEVLEERERLDGALNAQVAGRVAGLSGAEERADVAEERGEAARERRRRVGAVGGRRALERVAELRPAWNSNLQPDFNVRQVKRIAVLGGGGAKPEVRGIRPSSHEPQVHAWSKRPDRWIDKFRRNS